MAQIVLNINFVPDRIVSFPRNLINESETRKGIATAFRMWSDVTPFYFKEVPADQESDLKIGELPMKRAHNEVGARNQAAPGPFLWCLRTYECW